MTKIFEALENAEKERGGHNPAMDLPMDLLDKPEPANYNLELEGPLTALYQKLYMAFPGKENIILQFVGSGNGDGASVITREFAKILAFKQKKSVLLLDAEQHFPGQSEIFNCKTDTTLDDIVQKQSPLKDALYRYQDSNLYITRVTNNGSLPALANDMPLFERILESLKKKFDAVLIDASLQPGRLSMLPLSKNIDGYILIVEAEKTKWQAAKKIKDIIESQNGNILGAILNKRRYPIPQKIYDML